MFEQFLGMMGGGAGGGGGGAASGGGGGGGGMLGKDPETGKLLAGMGGQLLGGKPAPPGGSVPSAGSTSKPTAAQSPGAAEAQKPQEDPLSKMVNGLISAMQGSQPLPFSTGPIQGVGAVGPGSFSMGEPIASMVANPQAPALQAPPAPTVGAEGPTAAGLNNIYNFDATMSKARMQ